jgi:hypothetical protein
VHLFHLLRDDVPAVRRLMLQRIETLGQWEELVRQDAGARATGDEAVATKLTARGQAARALVDAWHVGHGRPIGRADLVESGAVSSTWLDRIESFAADVDGDAARLLEEAAKPAKQSDERLKGFREAKREALREHLLQVGALDEREVLTPDDQDIRVRESAEGLSAAEATRLAEQLREQLDRALAERRPWTVAAPTG